MHIGGYYTLQHSDQCTSLIKLSIKPPIDVNLHIYKNRPCNLITMIACQINYNWLQCLISCRLLFLNHAPLHTFTKLHQKELYHGSMVAAKPYQNPIRVSPHCTGAAVGGRSAHNNRTGGYFVLLVLCTQCWCLRNHCTATVVAIGLFWYLLPFPLCSTLGHVERRRDYANGFKQFNNFKSTFRTCRGVKKTPI